MGVTGVRIWVFLLVIYQVSTLVTPEEQTCVPGFEQNNLIVRVSSKHLRQHVRLGNVNFDDCTGRTRFPFISSDSRVSAQTDGVLTVKRPITLYEGHLDFFINTWDSQGRKYTLPVRLLHQERHGDVDNTEGGMEAQVPVVYFRKSGEGLRRRKRDWVIPPINVYENNKGPYPLKISQIHSNQEKLKKIFYNITGPGADESPVNLFTLDRESGALFVTQQLDREEQAKYTLKVHAVAEGSENAEEPMDIVVNVIDQNDNKPVFVKDTFLGEVAEASPRNFDVIQVEAKDLDEPDNYNSDIRYSILNQEPKLPSDNLFDINPVTGVIRVIAGGLDKEKYPKYTLTVQAADTEGRGLTGIAKVILIITDSNSNTPAFTPSSGGMKTQRDWVIPEISVSENHKGPYPLKISQIRSCQDKLKKIFYIITGPGADQPPVNLFTLDRESGTLFVTQQLDREEQAMYTLKVHAMAVGSRNAEEPMDIVVNVTDQNDNKPVFVKDTFLGEVAEASPRNFDVIQVEAKDLDEPDNYNSDIRYSILNQEPKLPSDNLFAINPATGTIRLNAGGLDREKYPKYTLMVQVADTEGNGLTGEAKVILTVTDSNGNAPVFTPYTHDVSVPKHEVRPKEANRIKTKRSWRGVTESRREAIGKEWVQDGRATSTGIHCMRRKGLSSFIANKN